MPQTPSMQPPPHNSSLARGAGGTPMHGNTYHRQLAALHSGSRKALFKSHLNALLSKSANLGAPPTQYTAGVQYRVQLTDAVEIPGFGEWLRPFQDVIIDGAFANTISSYISSSEVVS